jgi:mono/diheme cytochrome c family protein
MSWGRRPPRLRLSMSVVLAALVAVALGGCGSGSGSGSGSSSNASHSPAIAGPTVSGRAVFDAHCEVCHSISARSTPEQQGGDLRGLHLPRRELVQFTVEMPIVRSRLTAAQVRAVVDYMQAVARRN